MFLHVLLLYCLISYIWLGSGLRNAETEVTDVQRGLIFILSPIMVPMGLLYGLCLGLGKLLKYGKW